MQILILAGAGASKALNPDAYPTTVEFFAQLPESITGDAFFASIADFLRGHAGVETIDIEQWLWAAAEVRQFLETAADATRPAGWLLSGNKLGSLANTNYDLSPFFGMGATARQRLGRLEDLINQQVYRWYSRPPKADELKNTWIPLLGHLTRANQSLELFTTNYDLNLEFAIELDQLPIRTGRRGGVLSQLDQDCWTVSATEAAGYAGGLLTKLHGSVDWSRSGDTVYFGTPTFRGKHQDHAIIYPGFKGMPAEKPFTLFHEHFVRSVSRADVIVAIGFAFRDEYLNQIFRDQVPTETRLVVVNPEHIDVPLPERQVVRVASRFGSKTIHAILRAIEVGEPAQAEAGS